jgi:hypothetical protein
MSARRHFAPIPFVFALFRTRTRRQWRGPHRKSGGKPPHSKKGGAQVFPILRSGVFGLETL